MELAESFQPPIQPWSSSRNWTDQNSDRVALLSRRNQDNPPSVVLTIRPAPPGVVPTAQPIDLLTIDSPWSAPFSRTSSDQELPASVVRSKEDLFAGTR